MKRSCWLFSVLLVGFFQLQVQIYRNGSNQRCCANALFLSGSAASLLTSDVEQSKLTVFVEEDVHEIFSSSHQAEVFRASAVLIRLLFAQVRLAPGAALVLRNPNDATNRFVFSSANVSHLLQSGAFTRSQRSSLWSAPIVFHGSRVILEYLESSDAEAPVRSYWTESPKVVLRTIEYAIPNGATTKRSSDRIPVQSESILNGKNEMKEAKCFKKNEPKMYNSARSVARLLIEKSVSPRGGASGAASFDAATGGSDGYMVLLGSIGDQLTLMTRVETASWYYCTGWLVGRENHLVTNHHCVFAGSQTDDAAVASAACPNKCHRALSSRQPSRNNAFDSSSSSSSSSSSLFSLAKINVNFMAETASCTASGSRGRQLGVIEARETRIVAASHELDYALLKVIPDSAVSSSTSSSNPVELWKQYGSLKLRASGPKNREEIYIPQHPLGRPKEIAAWKDHNPAIIRVMGDSSDTQVVYNADTQPGSSGSPVLARKDNKVIALHQAGGVATALDNSTETQVNAGIRIDRGRHEDAWRVAARSAGLKAYGTGIHRSKRIV